MSTHQIQAVFDDAGATRGMIQYPRNLGVDASDFGLDGTAANIDESDLSVMPRWDGGAIDMDGTAEQVTWASEPAVVAGSEATIAFVVSPNAYGATERAIWSEGQVSSATPLFYLYIKGTSGTAGQIEYYERTDGGVLSTWATSGVVVPVGRPTLWLWCRDAAGAVSLYDEANTLRASSTLTIRTPTIDQLGWGVRVIGGVRDNRFQGKLGAFVTCNKALDASQRGALIRAMRQNRTPPTLRQPLSQTVRGSVRGSVRGRVTA